MCSYLMLEIKSVLKKRVVQWTRVHFREGVKSSKILKGLLIHGIIGVHSGPPKILGPPLIPKLQVPP